MIKTRKSKLVVTFSKTVSILDSRWSTWSKVGFNDFFSQLYYQLKVELSEETRAMGPSQYVDKDDSGEVSGSMGCLP